MQIAGGSLLGLFFSGETAKATKHLEEILNQEGKDGPEIEIEIFFGPHVTGEDAAGLKEKIKACDIFIPESLGWTPEILSSVRDMAKGKINPEINLKNSDRTPAEIKEIEQRFGFTLLKYIYITPANK